MVCARFFARTLYSLTLIGLLISTAQAKITEETLGTIIFNDPDLSNPKGLSCARCHQPDKAFADPGNAVSAGAVEGSFGKRNTPSLKYISFVPAFSYSDWSESWRGGQFWDGRVDTLEEQALGPFLNAFEMNNTEAGLAASLRKSTYIQHFKTLYGEATVKDDGKLVRAAAKAVAAFQRTEIFEPFDSKYDYMEMGLVEFTAQEKRGEELFDGQGMCIDCHVGRDGEKQLFTQFAHHNIKVPPNPELAFYTQPKAINPDGKKFVDLGTGLNPKLTKEEAAKARGVFKTPSLRNIAVTAPYMHNGVFASLDEVMDYYIDMEKFWPAEVDENRSSLISSALNFSEQDKADVIAFMRALTDGYDAGPGMKKRLREAQEKRWAAYEEYMKQEAAKAAAEE